jgi:hypothetical protein
MSIRSITLTDQELHALILALRYWRSHRVDRSTRRGDPPLTHHTIDLLLARLDAGNPSTPPTDLPADAKLW